VFEGRGPRSRQSVQIFIAPIFLVAEVFFALGLKRDVRRKIEERLPVSSGAWGLFELQDPFVDFRRVRRLRPPPQIVLQVGQRRPEAFELLVHQPTIPKFLGRLRHHEQHLCMTAERVFEPSSLRIDVLQIAQDPRDDLARGAGSRYWSSCACSPSRGQNLREALAQVDSDCAFPR